MGRAHEGRRVVAAAPVAVYRALLDRVALEAWLAPDGMTARFERFDPSRGGGYRLVLTYLDPTGRPGKTSAGSDVVEVEYVDLVPDATVVQRVDFLSDDPAFAGPMTMSWHLSPVAAGTLVTVRAEDVPPGISDADHEAGIASSLANLAAYVEAGG